MSARSGEDIHGTMAVDTMTHGLQQRTPLRPDRVFGVATQHDVGSARWRKHTLQASHEPVDVRLKVEHLVARDEINAAFGNSLPTGCIQQFDNGSESAESRGGPLTCCRNRFDSENAAKLPAAE
jgi:hypothetical protein